MTAAAVNILEIKLTLKLFDIGSSKYKQFIL